MESFRARLEACDPARGQFQAYRIDADTDLFGAWLVDVTYGRLGARGRRIRYVAGNEAEARRIVRHCLHRRASAPKRIGVAYRIRELDDSGGWLLPEMTRGKQTSVERDTQNRPAMYPLRPPRRAGSAAAMG